MVGFPSVGSHPVVDTNAISLGELNTITVNFADEAKQDKGWALWRVRVAAFTKRGKQTM